MTSSLHRGLAVVAAPALALTLLAGPPAQAHGDADAPQITRKDFPTRAQVGAVYRDLRKADVDRSRGTNTFYLKSCRESVYVPTRRRMDVDYSSPTARQNVGISVIDHRSTKAARKVMQGLRREIRCGTVETHRTLHFTRTRTPRLGDEAVGRLVSSAEGSPPDVVVHTFRRKNRVIELVVSADSTPHLGKARTLARIAYRLGR